MAVPVGGSAVRALFLCLFFSFPLSAQPEDPPSSPSSAEAVVEDTETSDPEASESEPAVMKEVVVTATRHESPRFPLPFSEDAISREIFVRERQNRTLPETLRDVPSVMIQKTAHGQASPFIRGFTGYRNLFLIDGIRLNNSTFRSGPNQYWSTVDHLSVDRVELVLGPSSVLYGSDAVGGTVNAITRRRASYEDGLHFGGRALFRYSSAESSFIERIEFEGNHDDKLGFVGGVSMKSFGDLEAGGDSGELPGTAYDQFDADFRLDIFPTDKVQWTLLYQHVSQDDVPRTHRTVRAVPFHGSSVGSELRRDLDQRRDLAYSRWTVEEPFSFLDEASFTISFQRQEQVRDRLRTGGRRDLSGFDVNTWGLQTQVEKDTSVGYWTAGVDFYYDDIDSFRDNFRDGVFSSSDVQGPLGDDADSSYLGIYAQNEFQALGVDWTAGLRYTVVRNDADRVDNPDVDGSDPTTPGNVISITDTARNLVGSLRGSVPLDGDQDEWRLFFGASQGFRAPSLHDLTSFDTTSVFEVPTENLDPEEFLSLEVGVKADGENLKGRAAAYYTFIDDLIVRSPTGEIIDDTPVVQKDNVGDGHVAGIELEGVYRIDEVWSAFGALAWQSGQVDQFRPTGEKVDKPLDRRLPLSGIVGVRYQPERKWWIEGFTRFADDQDRLSLRDETDTERIPPGGTPGWATVNLRGGWDVTEKVSLSAAVENLGDKDYRIHGSGQNEPGTNVILTVEVRF